ncbi:MAG: inositol phosphorylceramide synthase [Deltaproteobacteria bacterium]|nr:MAG: inositol phosphorylceramide synthase [Deltaproteobacteria bacterium]
MKKIKSFTYTPLLIAFIYYVLLILFVEVRPEHIAVSWAYLILFYSHPKTRTWCKDLLPFGLYGAVYDFLRAYPKNWAGPIHVVGPYQLEKFLFGFNWQGIRVTPNEFFQTHQHVIFDVIGGFMYSMHVIGPIFLAITLWFTHRTLSRQFLWAYLLSGILSLITYIIFPVAPPWYVTNFGLIPASWSVPGNAAGLINFDHLIGASYYQNIFSKNAWAFGALPSMHGGHAFMVGYFGYLGFGKKGLWLAIYPLLMWFSIVYLNHHYIIDIIAGALYVLASHEIIKLVFKKIQSSKIKA